MKKRNTYKILKIRPRLSTTLAILVVLDIIAWFNTDLIIASVVTVITIGVMFKSKGFIIDKENNRIRKVTNLFGITFGRWHKLPEIKYVSLLRVRLPHHRLKRMTELSKQNKAGSFICKVNLIIEENRQRAFQLMSTSQYKAIIEGVKLADYLDVKVLDVTTLDKKWRK